jgi:glucuronate isomerase
MEEPAIRQRVAKKTGIDIKDSTSLREALAVLFQQFTRKGARACALSLPPTFAPAPVSDEQLSAALQARAGDVGVDHRRLGVFWILAEHCRTFRLPFDLMLGVNRRVFEQGVHQGQDLFDQRTSLIQYAQLFNAFPDVTFCVSVLSSGQNQELVSYSWIFPNVITSGHWWYSNIPAYIQQDLRARLQAVPKTKQIGYYSDMYKLEFGLPKFNMYRRILAQVLADDFIRPRLYSEMQALEAARLLLHDNAHRIFNV